MNSVMISIKPKWCELIASRQKTIEVRKTKPKCAVPFKCYIYCTMDNAGYQPSKYVWKPDKTGRLREIYWNGKVIGEFICDEIIEYECISKPNSVVPWYVYNTCAFDEGMKLSEQELSDYGQGKKLYGWSMCDLVIYDEPKELSEFFHNCGEEPNCENCPCYYYSSTENGTEEYCCSKLEGCKPLSRPPQSWCYVEVEE